MLDMTERELQDCTVVVMTGTSEDAYNVYEAESLAVCAGIATDVIKCPHCGTLSGVARTARLRGTAFDFNASVNVKLYCGHWVV